MEIYGVKVQNLDETEIKKVEHKGFRWNEIQEEIALPSSLMEEAELYRQKMRKLMH